MWNRNSVLIVDPNRHVRRLLCRVAQGAGLRAVPLADVALAFDIAAERRPDVIVLDVELADPAGRNVLKSIKGDPRTREIPVFVHAGSCAPSDRIVAFELGAAPGVLETDAKRSICSGAWLPRLLSFCWT
jgi:CheY-like chemotaxis protein